MTIITRSRRKRMHALAASQRLAGTYIEDSIHFEINLTYRCNRVCKWCNRGVGQIAIPNSEVSIPQLERMCEVIRGGDLPFISRFKVAGGEPMMHPHFDEAIELLATLLPDRVGSFWVLSNGIKDRPNLPKGFIWKVSPPTSKNHDPNWVSPQDLPEPYAVEQPHGTKENPCVIMKKCGSCFDTWGFCVCAAAGTLARIFRVNIYSDEPQFHCPDEIRKHCVWSSPRSSRERLWRLTNDKYIGHPSLSFRQGFDLYKKDPIIFEKF